MSISAKSAWPDFSDDEVAAVAKVLASGKVNYWTGTECREFEIEFARWCGADHAVALANGTLALDIALKALGVGPGDEVVVTPRSFMASVSTVINAGANPVFADVDRDSGNMTAETIAEVLTERTRAVIPVHLAGWPCNMDAIMALAANHSLFVIEDCAQAHGGRIAGQSVGTFGHVAAWSFCQDKIMTTGGEGGMVTTNDHALWRAMWSYKDHGKSWDAIYNRAHPPGFRWVHEQFGTNWRMLEMQAVLGRIQLTRMAEWSKRRTRIAKRYLEVLERFPALVRAPLPSKDMTHAYYRLYAYVQLDGLRSEWSRDRIVADCSASGVAVMHGSCSEIYREKAFDGTPWRPAHRLPVARELGETSLAFLCHPTMTDDELGAACDALDRILTAASR
ncbi:MAG: DegT/DnrJ/EryC1/StrS aminotransferase family protein [Sphingopyxis sp.]|nr:DegT/DnrJ/EryC1/StrS aminotransferase family protein [Sphingopyxis sp.]